jgi:CheY-like chemotaxis protein
MEVILQSGRYLLTLISDILDLSRIEAGRFHLIEQDFNLPELLNSLAELFKARAAEKGLAFNYEPLSQLPIAVRGDDRRLRQVLNNLLGNAVKFTHQGGITLQVNAQDYSLQVDVIDTGIGIAAQDIEAIFNPFQQVSDINNKSEGTGLGLSISHSLIEMMGGSLTVTSELGHGSRFSFSVTLAIASEPLKASNLLSESAVITGFVGLPKTILVVDDHWENRVIVRDLLTPLGFNIIEADEGQKALIAAEQHSPDCVITDLVMPVMDGFELIRHLRKNPRLSQVPIIAASASVIEAPDAHAACDSFIHKPFHTDDLLALLQQHLQLEWQYDCYPPSITTHPATHQARTAPVAETAANTAPVNLTAEEAEQLYESAMMGDISGILTQVEALEQRDPQLQPLAQQIRSLAQAFDEEGICRLVERYRTDSS